MIIGDLLAEIDENNPVFLDNLIQIGETCYSMYYNNVEDQEARAGLTTALQKFSIFFFLLLLCLFV